MDVDDYVDTPENRSPVHSPVNTVTTDIPFLPLGLGIIIVTVLGIFGNFICGTVLSRHRLRSSYSVLTLGLLTVDSIYLLTKLLRYGVPSALEYQGTGAYYLTNLLPLVGPYLRAITFTAHTASTYFTIAIAVDRFVTVCCPNKAGKVCTRRFAGVVSVIVIVWSCAFNATRWLEFESVWDEANSKYKMEKTDLRNNPDYRSIYIFWLYFIFMFAIPFVSLLYMNTRIILGIIKISRSGARQTTSQIRDMSFSIMLIGVVVVFLLCNVDYLVLDILEYAQIKFPEFWNHLGNFLLTINSAVNFLIYCVCGRKFRSELWNLIRDLLPCLKQRGSHDIVATDVSNWGTITNKDGLELNLQSIPRASLSRNKLRLPSERTAAP